MVEQGWKVARIEEIEARNWGVPVREHLGISGFGVNAFRTRDDGTIITSHDEAGSGQQELYVVVEGTATFTVDGEDFDAPAGTLVFVDPAAKRTARGDGVILAIGATPGQAYEALDWGAAWPVNSEAMALYNDKRYAEAAQVIRDSIDRVDHPGLHYNLACFGALSGQTDEVFEHLRLSVEQWPGFRDQAPGDDDFASVRDDPRFAEALR
jgi:mannose-6-phosphate isomerase-like protein (cupin superfamily)